MRIGLISDTHGHFDPKIHQYFNSVDEIWHAGDIGAIHVLEELIKIKPLKSVYGNIDGQEIRNVCPEYLHFKMGGVSVLLIHIADRISKYNPQVNRLIKDHHPQLLICGHSHILKVAPDKKNNLLYMNPGAAGIYGFHKVKTLLRFTLDEGEIKDLEVVELGPRARLKQ
ncbi:MAG: metallophosphoesterase family protein [Cytophagales bacterium]|nr:metallophosphoesterase family protein [Cytophagales bacterium]